ncbi:ComEA family DNA-binding protein [Paenibacillus sp. 22594]|uniref:ComEA family DNA-binding protein n=1 Tax=Paenibacillus sp. 22594 TaxID=3453947 RepID=UPI003F83DB2A
MNKKGIASVFAAALLGGGLVWAADREENKGIGGWETLNASMAQALGTADEPGTAVAAGGKDEKGIGNQTDEQKKGDRADAVVTGDVAGGTVTGGRPVAGDNVAESTGTAGGGAAGASDIESNAGTAGSSGTATTGNGAAATAVASEAEASGSEVSSGQASAEGKINVNTADAAALMNLPGIGEKKAQAIIDYRSSKGAFRSLADLGGVKGIGPKMLEKLKPLVGF